jgi:hypothetical protein
MTYIVAEPYDYKRLATAEVPSLEFLWAFYTPMALGLPLTPELLALTPNPLVIHPPRKGSLPDVFNGKNGVWIVSRRARDVIEALEPSVHTFIPANLQSSKDGKSLGQAFLVYMGLTIDAVDRERTTFGGGRKSRFRKRSFADDGLGCDPARTVPRQAPLAWRDG